MYPGGARVGAEELAALTEVVRTQRLFRYYGNQPGASMVEEFENRAAQRLGASHVQAVSSACGGLLCAFAALGVGPGDEVIVPAFTWIATASAVIGVGAVPIIAEVDATLNLDPADVERKITPRTKAIAVVHMRGGAARMSELLAISRRTGVPILEDAAQAFGGSYLGQSLGTLGKVGVFSLQYNKIITSGEGGLVVTGDGEIWKRVAMVHDVVGALRNNIPDEHSIPGLNFRMSELQGAVAVAQLGKLDSILADMRSHHAAIRAGIQDKVAAAGGSFREQPDPAGDCCICLCFFLPKVSEARRVVESLEEVDIPAMNLYRDETDYHVASDWAPVLRKTSWSSAGAPWAHHPNPPNYTRDDWPQTLDLLRRSVHLDISPDLTEEHIENIVTAIRRAL
jgi:dTDP-4-amino-4,6-dideoxygalactose transaminase